MTARTLVRLWRFTFAYDRLEPWCPGSGKRVLVVGEGGKAACGDCGRFYRLRRNGTVWHHRRAR